MKILKINYNNYNRLKTTIKKIENSEVFIKKPQVTGLLPKSMKKSKTTGLTTCELIFLNLKNL